MKAKTVSKMTTVLAVFLLVLSGIMVLQIGVRADERKTGSIEGIVYAQDESSIPKGLEVRLIDLSEDETVTTSTERGGFFKFSDVDVGYYRIEFPSQAYKEESVYFQSMSSLEMVQSGESTIVDLTVEREMLDLTLNGTVTDQLGNYVEGTSITIEDVNSTYSTTVGVENTTTGYYEVPLYNSTFTITATSPDYPSNITYGFNLNESKTLDIELSDNPKSSILSGYLWSEDGYAVTTSMEVTLISDTKGIFHTSIESGPYFEIGVPSGDYTLVVDSVGYLPYHNESITLVDYQQENLERVYVEESQDESIETDINFNNFNNITIERTRTYRTDTKIEALDYSYLGNLKLQIDLALGNADFQLSYDELQQFKEEMKYRESEITSSQHMITVDGIPYKLNKTINWTLEADGLNSSGDTVDVFNMSVEMNSYSKVIYHSYSTVKTSEEHDIDLYLKKDHTFGNYRDYTYNLKIPSGYERTNTPDGIDISGYTDISLDPTEGMGTQSITLTVEQSESGEADIILDIGPKVYMKNENRYIVKKDTNVSCTADFQDPVGDEEEAIYEWFIGTQKIGEGQEIYHIFSSAGEKNLKLTITETGGQITNANVTVLVDDVAPQGTITTNKDTVKEGEELEISAYGFTDNGVIGDFEWNYSDETGLETGMNVTHAYQLKGTYTLKLNITDVVGNWEIYTEEIEVTDATKPVARFTFSYMEDGEEVEIESANLTGKTIKEGTAVTLDASDSYDPAGLEGDRTDVSSANWFIQKDSYKSEDEVVSDYQFQGFGTYRISLNVTDEAGNYHNMSKEIEVTMGARPNLELTGIKFAETPLRDGQTATVIANVTNYGTDNATNLEIFFRVGNKDVPVDSFTVETIEGEETDKSIPSDSTRLIKFDWDASGTGSKTIHLNITDENEPTQWTSDNAMDNDVNIEPPAWRRYIVYIIIPVVIVGVVVGLYYYRERF